MDRQSLFEHRALLKVLVRRGPIHKSTLLAALRKWDAGGRLNEEGIDNIRNQRLSLKRYMEDVKRTKVNATTGVRPLIAVARRRRHPRG